MSNRVIPKEQLSAYQRWELDTLEDPAHAGQGRESVALPTAEDVERIQAQASQEGFAAGYREGKEQARAEALRFNQMLTGLGAELEHFEQAMGQEMLALVLEICRQMVRQALQVKPELVLGVVREAINSLPHANHHPHIALHPDDAALVRTHLAEELAHSHWRIVEDAHMQRGGCRLETASSEIDATLESRWQRVLAALGQEGRWLD